MESKTIKRKERNKKVAHTTPIFRFQKCLMLNSWVADIANPLGFIVNKATYLLPFKKKYRLQVLISLVSKEFSQYTFLCQRSQLWLLCYDSIYFLKSNCMKWGRIDFLSFLCWWEEMKSIFQYMFIVKRHIQYDLSSVRLCMGSNWQNFRLSVKFGHIVNNLNQLIRNAGALWHFVSLRNAFPMWT